MDSVNFIYLITNIVIALGTLAGGYIAFRHGFNKQASEIQERVIDALETEMNTLRVKINTLEKDNEHLRKIIDLITQALNTRGWKITIDGDIVSVNDNSGGSHTGRIQGNQHGN